MAPTVYLETTIVSYLAAWPSRDLLVAAHQQITHTWWNAHRNEFGLFVSEVVLDEAGRGDPEAANRRAALLTGIPQLAVSNDARALAPKLVNGLPLPKSAGVDALHIAVATVHGMDYLLTWNCKHIARAVHQHGIERICRQSGFEPPVICTPEALLGE